MRRSIVIGCGAYLPEKAVSNEELSRRIDTSDDWIRQRTGIRQRHIAADGEFTSHLALHAARDALARAGCTAGDIDVLVLATATPDNTFPATAARVQAELGMKRGAAFDVQAVCSGFVYATSIADNMLRLGQATTALVIGAETFSRILDWSDRSTCVLFGDGAGAVVLRAAGGGGTNADRGILSTHLFSDGSGYEMLYVDGGPSTTGKSGHLRMHGREVFRHAVTRMAEAVEISLQSNNLSADDLDWVVPHQANIRIMDSMAKRLGLSREQIVVTVDRQANTSAATIPLALAAADADGRLKQGQLVSLTAMGGGFTWGSVLLRW
ncbi:MAG: beta-ketoacyl-ACP synthase III [Alphaproteobacteria bacterium]|nr:beta-ketoacyl-ACP synthase III [Alphaproteobacteria bacterium]